jgi:hypothetical protein
MGSDWTEWATVLLALLGFFTVLALGIAALMWQRR